MGLKADLTRAVLDAFRAFGDLINPCDYYAKGALVRDLEAGTISQVPTKYTIKMSVVTRFKTAEKDKWPSILFTNSKLLFPSSLLSIDAKPEDYIIDYRNRRWDIVQMLTDPGELLTICEVRKS